MNFENNLPVYANLVNTVTSSLMAVYPTIALKY